MRLSRAAEILRFPSFSFSFLSARLVFVQPKQNNLKGMYEALCDLVDLLTHKNPNILAAVCQLIEAVACHDENLKIMNDAGIIESLANLVTTVCTPSSADRDMVRYRLIEPITLNDISEMNS